MSVQSLSTSLTFEWILAGGIALELFVGHSWRAHEDIDVIIKRSDQHLVTNSFDPERIFIAETPGILTPFDPKRFYHSPIQDIWILDKTLQFWILQIMLVDVEDGDWVYKRDNKIRKPYTSIFFEKGGIRILKPEIQLLYKSHKPSQKDLQDMEKVVPLLNTEAHNWLRKNSPYFRS